MSNAISELRDTLEDALRTIDGVNVSRVPADTVKPPHLVVGEISITPATLAGMWTATVVVYVFVSAADARNVERAEEFMAPDADRSVTAAIGSALPAASFELVDDAGVFQFAGVDYFGSRVTITVPIQ
jgi:hypothetical protein